MLPTSTRLISVDDHITEPPTLWTDRLPQRFAATGPHVVELDDGRQVWAFEDQLIKIRRGNAMPRSGFDDNPDVWSRFEEMRPGCYDSKARLADMDEDGLWGSLAFPDFARFSGHRFLEFRDQELSILCVRAYNDFVFEEWCAADRDRLYPLVIVPYWNVPEAIAEIQRTAALGAKAVAFSENPVTLGLPSIHSRHFDPLFAAIAEADLPICMHIGSSSRVPKTSPDAPASTGRTVVAINSIVACSDWLFSGILERFPSLQIVFSEGGAGWAPFILERAMESFIYYGSRSGATVAPDQLFAEHMHVCMIREDFALRSLGPLPVDNLLWETDYPHESTTFPHSRGFLEAAMADVPDADAVKIVEGNPRRLFRL